MTVLYTTGFEQAQGAITGWANGPSNTFIGGVNVSPTAGSGSAAFSEEYPSGYGYARYEGIAATADAEIASSHKALFTGNNYISINPLFRCQNGNGGAPFEKGYAVCVSSTDGAALKLGLYRLDTNQLFAIVGVAQATGLSVVAGDVIRRIDRVVGTTVQSFIWKDGTTQPTTPTATFTINDSAPVLTAGYCGVALYKGGATSGVPGIDEYSISTASIAATVPSAPTIGAASVVSATSVSVNGTAPGNNGGAAITGYRATSTPGSITATSATLPVTVPGLTTGTAYTFRLEAQNSVGYSSQSAASNSVTPATGNQAPAFGGTYANVSGTIGTPLSAPAATSYFTDTDTLTYSASPAGTAWPAGVTCNAATGQPTGTPTGSAATTTGCKIRASDGSLTTDSNSFNFVIGAALGNKTYTSTKEMKRVNGTVAAGVSLKAIVSLLDGTYLDTKPGVVTNSSGVPAPFTSTFGTAGTPTRIVWVEESAPTNPAPTENVTPT